MPIDEDRLIISLRGEYDLSRVDELTAELEGGVDRPNVIVDLTDVSYADSTFLTSLIRMHNRRRALGHAPVRLVLPRSMRKIFTITRLDGVLAIFDTLDDAINAQSV
jgi:anti-sigma B factor antagonist